MKPAAMLVAATSAAKLQRKDSPRRYVAYALPLASIIPRPDADGG